MRRLAAALLVVLGLVVGAEAGSYFGPIGTGSVGPAGPPGLGPGLDYTPPCFTIGVGIANQAVVCGSATGGPVSLSAVGSDTSIPVALVPKGPQGFIQVGPDTYGTSGWSGYNLFVEGVAFSPAVDVLSYGIYLERIAADATNAESRGIFAVAYGPGTDADITTLVGGDFLGAFGAAAGGSITHLVGVQGIANMGGGDATEVYASGFFTRVNGPGTTGSAWGTHAGTGISTNDAVIVTDVYGGHFYVHLDSNVTATSVYGVKIDASVAALTIPGTVGTLYSLYLKDIAVNGIEATNNYYFWADSRGVFRIREDSTFDSVRQAIPALYNPQFTKYTPGATNFERIILSQWNGNVAEIGTEKGGTGTLRPLRLIGASVEIPNRTGTPATFACFDSGGKLVESATACVP